MPSRRARALVLALLLTACTNDAWALRTLFDGGPEAGGSVCEAPTPWRVTAHGALTYDSATSNEPTSFTGTVTGVDDANATFTVASGDAAVDVVLTPRPRVGLRALQVGATVSLTFDRGVVVEEYGNLILSMTETHDATLAIRTVFDTIRVAAAEPICTFVTDGGECANAITHVRASVSDFDATVSLTAGEGYVPTRGGAYDVTLIASERPATESERSAASASTAPACTSIGLANLVVATTAIASDAPTPRCTSGNVLNQAAFYQVPDWHVRATGSVAYDTATEMGPGAGGAAIERTGTVASVDASAGSFELATAGGTIDVGVAPLRAGWLDALSIARSVSATFHDGVVVRDAATGELLLAVIASAANPASLDAGPIHVRRGDDECVRVRSAGSPCEPGGVVIRTRFEAAISLGAVTTTVGVGDAPARLSDGTDDYEVSLVASVSQSGSPANPMFSCDVGIQEGLFVAIGRPSP